MKWLEAEAETNQDQALRHCRTILIRAILSTDSRISANKGRVTDAVLFLPAMQI